MEPTKIKLKFTFKGQEKVEEKAEEKVKEKLKKKSPEKEETPKKVRVEGAFLAEQAAAIRKLIPLKCRKYQQTIVNIPLISGTLKQPMWVKDKAKLERAPKEDPKDFDILACDVCDKIYSDKSKLKRHMKTHN